VTEIRSFRRVFDLERRIYRVDRLRLNPAGVPVRGIVYLLALIVLSLIAGRLPLLARIASALPWYVRVLALPGASATVLSVIRIEGRPFHLAARALVGHRLRPSGSAGACRYTNVRGRWYPDEILMLPDGSDGSMRRMRYTGPGAVLVTIEHERAGGAIERGAMGLARRGRRPELVVRERPDGRALERGQVISLGPGMRLLVRSRGRGAEERR
jgi:hypothetical protein